jgi:hypothetical protein
VQRKESDPERQEQYLYLLHFWANKPERLVQASLPTGVFTAFGLKPLDGSKTATAPQTLKPLSPNKESEGSGTPPTILERETDKPEVERDPPVIQQFIKKLDDWKNNGVLGQGEANKIRGWINTHLIHSINWEAELLRSVKPTTNTYQTSIYLPRAKGNPPNIEKAFVVVADDEQFKEANIANEVFSVIRAMLRYDHYGDWDYDQSDEDYVYVANFIDSHLENASVWVRAKYKNVDGIPVSSLVQSLLWQSRQLNIESAHKKDDASQLDAVFASPVVSGSTNDDGEWRDFLCDLFSHHKLLQEELLERVGAFQGTGKTPHAVDAFQLLSTIQEFRKTWKLSEKFPSLLGGVSDELKAIEKHVGSLYRLGSSKIDARRKRIAEQSKRIVDELGQDYDKSELLKDLESVCTLSQQYGLSGDISVNQIRQLAEKFHNAAVKDVGKQVDEIVSGDDLPAQMTAIAKLDIETHALLVEFSQTCAQFLRERAGKAQNKILAWSAAVVEKKKLDVDEILKTLEEAVVPYQKVDA